MVNTNDPIGSVFNSIQEALLPIESGIRRAAKDLPLCSENNGNDVEFVSLVNGRNRKSPMSYSASKKSKGQNVISDLAMINVSDPFVSILDLIQVVLSPIESGIRGATKSLELCRKEQESNGKGAQLDEQVNGNCRNRKCLMHSLTNKKSNGQSQSVVGEARKSGFSKKLPIEEFMGGVFRGMNCGHGVEVLERGLKVENVNKDNGDFVNFLQFIMCWPLKLGSISQAIPSPFKPGKKLQSKVCDDKKSGLSPENKILLEGNQRDWGVQYSQENTIEGFVLDDSKKHISAECSIGLMFNGLIQNLQKLHLGMKGDDNMECILPDLHSRYFGYDYWNKIDIFSGNLKFARLGGVPSTFVEITSADEEAHDGMIPGNERESDKISPRIPLSNKPRSTLSAISFTDFIELLPQPWQSSKDDHPDKKKLLSIQAFFKYAESEGRRFFQELDRDGDGQITLEDLEVEMRKRKLPQRYATEVIRRARHNFFSKSFGWKQFLSLMEKKEPSILRAYTSLSLSKSEKLQKGEILESLRNAGLAANEDNAVALMHFLNTDSERSISYGHFRNFMLLLPSDQLKGDHGNIWFEDSTSATDDASSPVKFSAGSVQRSALAGGLSCALSAALMHPIDTVKTRVQASTQLSFLDIMAKLPETGPRGLYRGLIPTVFGQFSSHALRTGLSEATKLVIVNIVPSIPDIQVQSIASFGGTFLGTVMRIPCEVLKQRLQAGLYENVGEAVIGTWRESGLKGLFRGTGVTLFREIPFYVAGTGVFEEAKKVTQHLLGRELQNWETIAVGAVSGGLTAVLTTPFDVIKTRMMISQQAQPLSMSVVAVSILRNEGALALFKGAVPRFFWIAPLGAINLAGYELAKKALDQSAHSIQ